MRPVLCLILALASTTAAACRSHAHGRSPDRELVTIQLTRGLS